VFELSGNNVEEEYLWSCTLSADNKANAPTISTEPEFANVSGAQESIPRNRF
jgi:hypothetical protein